MSASRSMWALWLAIAACGGGAASSTDTEAPEPYPPFDEAVAMAAQCEAPDVVAVEVRSIAISARGTRSQTMELSAVVLASKNGLTTVTLDASHYVGGDVFMEEGGRYLAVVCDGTHVLGWRTYVGESGRAVAAVELPDQSTAADPAAAGPPVRYFIEDDEVDQATFEALFSRLTIDEEPLEAETVENEDGSYGGNGATYGAREGETEYRYRVTSFVEGDEASESRSIRRLE